MAMTRTEIEADLRIFDRTCKGAPYLAYEQRVLLNEQWQRVESSRNWTAALIFLNALEKAAGINGHATFPADDWENMFRRVHELVNGYRRDCGYDINALILSHPLDGEEKTAPCPGCGKMITWVPRNYDAME